MKPERVSVGYELAELQQAVEGARRLVEMIVNDYFDTDADVRPICRAAAAVLAVTGARLHLVTRVVHGHVDADVLAAPFNDAQAAEPRADVVLRARAGNKKAR